MKNMSENIQANAADGTNTRKAFEDLFSSIYPASSVPSANVFERVSDDSRYCSLEVEYAWRTYDAVTKQIIVASLIEAGALRQFRHNDGSEGFVAAYHDHFWPTLGMTEHTWEAPGAMLLTKIFHAMSAAAACTQRITEVPHNLV